MPFNLRGPTGYLGFYVPGHTYHGSLNGQNSQYRNITLYSMNSRYRLPAQTSHGVIGVWLST